MTVMLALVAATAMFSATPAPVFAEDNGLPRGFVYLRDVDASIRQDIRYAGAHNFIGRPVAGYAAPECVLTRPAAQALKQVQAALRPRGYGLVVWDCYRPARAVADFMRWTEDPDSRMKAEFYPQTDKTRLVALGYIAARSSHASASTVDLGLIPLKAAPRPPWTEGAPLKPCTASEGERFDDGTIDLGTGFDCFDERAHIAPPELGAAARQNRALLGAAMARHGFASYRREWWHFRLVDQPYPNRMFDFPIPPRRPAAP